MYPRDAKIPEDFRPSRSPLNVDREDVQIKRSSAVSKIHRLLEDVVFPTPAPHAICIYFCHTRDIADTVKRKTTRYRGPGDRRARSRESNVTNRLVNLAFSSSSSSSPGILQGI